MRSSSPAPPTQRRNRAALRDYYNLKTRPGDPAQPLSRTASIASTASDATLTSSAQPEAASITSQLDDSDFSPEKYIQDLLRKSSFHDVLKTESVLVSEIRTLDGERKALVYDNYSKLIKAVGTIGEMQRGTQNGLGGMEKVQGKVDGLVNLVGSLGEGADKAGLQARKQLREVRRKKEVVQWALDSPRRLQELMNQGKKEEAEQEWGVVQGLLRKWGRVDGAQELRRRCEEAMKDKAEEQGDEQGGQE